MPEDNNQKFIEFLKKILRKLKPRFSFHYVAYTTLFLLVIFSTVKLAGALTPNPGHQWSEVGDGVFAVTNNQSAVRTYTFPDANATILTTNAAVTVAQGGTNLTSIADKTLLVTTGANTLSALTIPAGQSVRRNATDTAFEAYTPGVGMTWPAGGAGIPNYSGSSSWGTSYTTTGSGTVVALATSPSLTTPSLGVATATSINGLSLSQDNTDLNVKVGTNAGFNIVSGATNNTFVGYDAGRSGSGTSTNAADFNTAVGYRSLYSNTTGYSDTAIGYQSLYSNADGRQNTAIGDQSLYSNTSGGNNIAIGFTSGRYIADGATANTTSDFSVYLGTGTKAGADNNQNEIVIGYNAIGNGSNTATIGNTSLLRTYLTGVNLKAGTATAGTAPLKFTSGTNLTTAEAGAMEWDGTNLFVTQTTGPTRKTLAYTTDITAQVYPGAGIANSTGSAWGTSYTTTGSGTVVALATTPTFTTRITTPIVLGGTATTQDLTLQTTSGAGTTGADMHFLVGSNGATEALTILNSGYVGIGETSPDYALNVKGVASFGDLATNSVLLGYDMWGGERGLVTEDTTEPIATEDGGIFGYGGGSPSDPKLAVIGSTGNVGLSTPSPTNLLSLSGTAARTIWMERNTTAATAGQGLTLSSGGAIAGTANLAGGDLNLSSGISTGTGSSSIRFFTATAGSSAITDRNPTEKMTILGDGNVGVGTTAPGQKLTVAGTDSAAAAFGSSADGIGRFVTTGSTVTLDIGASSTSPVHTWIQSRNSGNYAARYGLVLNPTGGNVGIGETTPTASLHIKAGTASAGTAPLKFTSGTNLTTAEAGAMEWNGTNLFVTQTSGPTRRTIAYTTDIPSLSGYVPYVGATSNLNLGAYGLITDTAQFNITGTSRGGVYISNGGAYSADEVGIYDVSADLPLLVFDIDNNKIHSGFLVSDYDNNNAGINVLSPTARLHLPAGTATAGTAPLKLTSGTALSAIEDGALEYHSSHLYFSIGSTRYQLDQQGGGGGNWDTIGDPSGNGAIAMGSTVQTMDWGTATTQNALSMTGGALTTGNLLSLTSNTLTSGALLNITSAGTGGLTNQRGLNIALSGTNGTSAQTTYGAYISNTHAGTTSTNVGLYATATGGTTANYAAIFDGGNVGIGTTIPNQKLDVNGNASINGIFFGKGTGSGLQNIALGNSNLQLNTTGTRNIGIGETALQANTTGSDNTAIGITSLNINEGGERNTAIGSDSLIADDQSDNIGIGYQVGYYGLGGGQNVLIGNNVASSPSRAISNSVFVGFNSGYNAGGENNVFLGPNSGYYEDGSNKIIIDNLDRTTQALGRTSSLIYGITDLTPANQILSLGGGGSVGINDITPDGTLDIDSSATSGINFGITNTGVYTGTGLLSVVANSATTGTVGLITANGLSSGNILSLTSVGTAALTNQIGLNIALSGINGTSAQTTYGAYISNTHAGTTSTNVGLYATATGGTSANYAGMFEGNVVLNSQSDLLFADADSSNYVALQAPATVTSNVTWTLPSADASGCFKSNGSGTMSISACGDTNLQTFASNGNYDIPTDALMVIVEGWGGGGGGGAGYSGALGTIRSGGAGGGGGAYNTQTILASTLGVAGADIPVTVGAGGTASTTTLGAAMDGGVGGRTCLSASSSCGGNVYLSAFGGAGGNGGSGNAGSGGGGGGGSQTVGVTNATQATYGAGGYPISYTAGSGGSNSGGGGGHGASAAATGAAGGSAFWGGAGGASSSSTGAGNGGGGGGSYKGGSAGGAGGSIATTYARRQGGAGGNYLNSSNGGGAAGANTDGAAGGNGASDTNYIHGGQGGGGGTTSSATVGGVGGNGGVPGGGGGGGGASNTAVVGSAGGAGGAGYMKIWTLRGSGADLAEVYGSNDDTITAGDVVALDKNMNAGVQKSGKAYDKDTIGIISTNPGLTIGSVEDAGATPVLVALSGRVPVKVNMENGPIMKGDYLTSSSVPGVAMKATKAGTIIGQAMTEYTNEEAPGFVVAFIKSGPSNGITLKEIIPGLTLEDEGSEDVEGEEENGENGENEEIITTTETIQKLTLSYFMANKIELEQATDISEIYTDRLSAALEIITPTVITDTLSTNSIVISTGEVISFNSSSYFEVPPLFNNDTAGFAIIKEGQRSVDIIFDEPYIGEPVVNASMAFSIMDDMNLASIGSLFDDEIENLIVNSSENGFTILINKDAPRDLRFSWTALSVKDPKIFESVMDGLIFEEVDDDSEDENQSIGEDDTNNSDEVVGINEELDNQEDIGGEVVIIEEVENDEIIDDGVTEDIEIIDDIVEETVEEVVVNEAPEEEVVEESVPTTSDEVGGSDLLNETGANN